MEGQGSIFEHPAKSHYTENWTVCEGTDTYNHSKALSVPLVFLRLGYIEFGLASWKILGIQVKFPVTSLKLVAVSKSVF